MQKYQKNLKNNQPSRSKTSGQSYAKDNQKAKKGHYKRKEASIPAITSGQRPAKSTPPQENVKRAEKQPREGHPKSQRQAEREAVTRSAQDAVALKPPLQVAGRPICTTTPSGTKTKMSNSATALKERNRTQQTVTSQSKRYSDTTMLFQPEKPRESRTKEVHKTSGRLTSSTTAVIIDKTTKDSTPATSRRHKSPKAIKKTEDLNAPKPTIQRAVDNPAKTPMPQKTPASDILNTSDTIKDMSALPTASPIVILKDVMAKPIPPKKRRQGKGSIKRARTNNCRRDRWHRQQNYHNNRNPVPNPSTK